MDMTQFGAKPVTVITGPKAGEQGWNFGIAGKPGIDGPVLPDTAPTLYGAAPHIAGKWDGKTSLCPFDAVRKLGAPAAFAMKAQMQPAGTCGGRAAKRGVEVLECLLVAAGRRASLKRVSHAYPYATARAMAGMLGPEDGVPDGSIPPAMAQLGVLTFEEAGETSDYGQGSDDLAKRWGARGVPEAMKALAADNRIGKDYARIRTLAEYADGCAAGGVAIVSDDNGYAMTRDGTGMCAGVREPWYHYHLWLGIDLQTSGEIRPVYGQSWGTGVPAGPTVQDGRWPDWCFSISQKNAEEVLQNNTVHMVFGFDLWDETAAAYDWAGILDFS